MESCQCLYCCLFIRKSSKCCMFQAPLIRQDAHRLRPEVFQQVLLLLGRQLGRQVPDEEGALSPGRRERSGAWASPRQRQRRLGRRHLPRRSSQRRADARRGRPPRRREVMVRLAQRMLGPGKQRESWSPRETGPPERFASLPRRRAVPGPVRAAAGGQRGFEVKRGRERRRC